MANTRKLVVEIAGDASGAKKAFDETERKGSSWGSKLGKVAGGLAIGLGGVGLAAGAMGLDLVHAAEDSAKVTAQSAAVIKSTGSAAHVTAGQVAELSTALSLKSGIDDELIQSGENVLLTFTNVRNEVGKGNDIFTRATGLALDMSTALGTDMQGSVVQLGKALNDPIKGITALSRVGVSFTKAQKDQIAGLVKHHDMLGAQKVILGELTKEFGGSAAAQATATGKLSVAWGNLQEDLGAKLLPAFTALTDWATTTGIPAIEKITGWFEQHRGVAVALAAVIGGVLVAATVAWGTALIAANLPLIAIGVAVGALVLVIVKNWDTIKRVTLGTFHAVTGAVSAALNWIKGNWPLLLGVITGPIGLAVAVITRHWGTIKAGVTAVRNWIVDRFRDVISFVTGLPGRLARAGAGMWAWIGNTFRSAINTVIRGWNGLSFTLPSKTVFGVKIGGWSLDTPNITPLAAGGIVRHTPGGILARIGEAGRDEAVTPLGPGGRMPVDVRLTVTADPRAAGGNFERAAVEFAAKMIRTGALQLRVDQAGRVMPR